MAVQKKQLPLVAILIALVVVGLGLLNWFFYLKPGLAKIDTQRETNGALEQEIESLNQKLSRKNEIEQRWKEMSEKEEELFSKVPTAAELPQILGALEELVKATKLELEAFSVGEISEDEGFRFVPVSLRAGGAEEKLLLLLEELEQFTHLTLTGVAGLERQDSKHRLSVEFNLILTPDGEGGSVGPEAEEEDQG